MRARTVGFMLGALLLCLFGWLSVQVYLSKTDPERFRAWDGPYAWIVGPPADALLDAAQQRVRRGLEILNDTSLPPRERLSAYRAELEAADALLVRSLRAQPAQAAALAQLAVIRWELNPSRDEEAVQEYLEMIALASSMAPEVPTIQFQLGELLLKMARRDEALAYLVRTLELDPDMSGDVVKLLRQHLFSAQEVLDSLPTDAHLLTALRTPFFEDQEEAAYLQSMEAFFDSPSAEIRPRLLSAYGVTCARLADPARLREKMNELGRQDAPAVEATRLQQLSIASMQLGQSSRAVEEARAAVGFDSTNPYMLRHLGDTALAAGDPGAAIDAYRNALGLVARGSADPVMRARLYSRIGTAEEARGNLDRAYDNYQHALALDPEDPRATKRLDALVGRTTENAQTP